MQRQAKRLILFIVAIAFLIVGAITLPTPLPLGLIFFVIGLALLVMTSRTFRNLIRNVRMRYPAFDVSLRSVQDYLPRPLSRALKTSAPRTRSSGSAAQQPAK